MGDDATGFPGGGPRKGNGNVTPPRAPPLQTGDGTANATSKRSLRTHRSGEGLTWQIQ